jgi:hypothetical protein
MPPQARSPRGSHTFRNGQSLNLAFESTSPSLTCFNVPFLEECLFHVSTSSKTTTTNQLKPLVLYRFSWICLDGLESGLKLHFCPIANE